MFDLIAFDADDTLWHNETLFQATARDFAALLSGHHPAEWIQERLFATELKNPLTLTVLPIRQDAPIYIEPEYQLHLAPGAQFGAVEAGLRVGGGDDRFGERQAGADLQGPLAASVITARTKKPLSRRRRIRSSAL